MFANISASIINQNLDDELNFDNGKPEKHIGLFVLWKNASFAS